MRWKAVIVLAALALTIAIPPSLQIVIDDDSAPLLITLNVCHTAVPALSSSGDMPCVPECPCRHCPSLIVEFFRLNEPIYILTPFSDRHYRPPKISV
ncbi:MAG: hypothetical protein A2X56_14805 [Nitrospirae bacterium GWC2_57_13]|jgi:hypothetical protein|nr:MAG: hypothetical protein A2X56_14805 [Nitrospirae bacterium GWC2_57_13]HAS53475.1 hypothetical protein [Nitrospiraceae bacterium]